MNDIPDRPPNRQDIQAADDVDDAAVEQEAVDEFRESFGAERANRSAWLASHRTGWARRADWRSAPR
ncbi:MAG: hypothetical protein ABEN55_16410 [Bradymonadaceae bacterium]